MIRQIIIASTLFSSTITFSQANGGGSGVEDDQLQLNTITTALPFLGITPDSRAGGMGDAGTALSPNSNSIYWNTAMLNFSEDDAEISVSYTPWLRALTNDIHLSYLSGYKRINKRMAFTGALRYFSLGEITFTDENNKFIRENKPSEFEIALGYSFLLNERHSIGVNGKFANSNLTGGLIVAGTETNAARAGIADISYAFHHDDIRWFGRKGEYNVGVTINNIGNKVAYSALQKRDFLPMNLKIGNAYTAKFDEYNKMTISLDIQRLLVPTPPIRDVDGVIIAGKDNNVGIISGLTQSFFDGPGRIVEDENGDYVQNSDGTYQIVKGSKFKEELTEFNIALGAEYSYNNILAFRGGYFYESPNKGARQFFNIGASFQYNIFGIDISYLAAVKRNNPLANTLRFTLRFKIGQKVTGGDAKPE